MEEHNIVQGKRRFRSELISFGISSTGRYVASGGTHDTFLLYEKPAGAVDDIYAVHWNPTYSRNSNFCNGEVRCIKFSPKVYFLFFWSRARALLRQNN